MTIELDKETRKTAILSIERYFEQELGEKIGNIRAGALLGFFLEEIGPSVYNQAVADVHRSGCRRASWNSTSTATRRPSTTGANANASGAAESCPWHKEST